MFDIDSSVHSQAKNPISLESIGRFATLDSIESLTLALNAQTQIASQLAQNGYFPLPLYGNTKKPIGEGWHVRTDWREIPFTDDGLVGIRCGDGGVFATDIDFNDAEILYSIRNSFELFDAPSRIGKRGCVLPARWSDGLGRGGHDLKYRHADGREAPIQIKARGQFAAYGVHPDTGKLYEWEHKRGPLNVPLRDLPTFDSMDALLKVLDFIMERYGFRRPPIVERTPTVFGVPAASHALIDVTLDEWTELGEWAEREVAAAIAELTQMREGTGRGTFAHDLGLRVGLLVESRLLDIDKIAEDIFAATFDDNAAYHSWPRGCSMSEGEAVAAKLEAIRLPSRLLEEAERLGFPVAGIPSPAAEFDGESSAPANNPALSDVPTKALIGALEWRALALVPRKPGRPPKAVVRAVGQFCEIVLGLVGYQAISGPDAARLAEMADGRIPAQGTPAGDAGALATVRSLLSGENANNALNVGVAAYVSETRLTTEKEVQGVMKAKIASDRLLELYGLLNADAGCSYVDLVNRRPLSDSEMKRALGHFVVPPDAGDLEYVEAFNYVVNTPRKHMFSKLVFTSADVPDDTFNLFKGYGVEPIKGECERILNHIQEVICAGNKKAADAMVKLIAWQARNIGKASRIVVTLLSDTEQTGKGTLIESVLGKLFGDAFRKPGSLEPVTGRFRSALQGTAVLFLDEVLFAGDRKSADAIKGIAATSIMGIETKGGAVINTPLGVNFWLASNRKSAAHIEHGDARYWVLKVSEHRRGDHAYFAALNEEIENGGVEAFLYYLLHEIDLTGFVPQQDVPRDNDARRAMIWEGLSAFDPKRWLAACVETETIVGLHKGLRVTKTVAAEKTDAKTTPVADEDKFSGATFSDDTNHAWEEGARISKAAIYSAYGAWARDVRGRGEMATETALGRLLAELGFDEHRTKTARYRVIPKIDALKSALQT